MEVGAQAPAVGFVSPNEEQNISEERCICSSSGDAVKQRPEDVLMYL